MRMPRTGYRPAQRSAFRVCLPNFTIHMRLFFAGATHAGLICVREQIRGTLTLEMDCNLTATASLGSILMFLKVCFINVNKFSVIYLTNNFIHILSPIRSCQYCLIISRSPITGSWSSTWRITFLH
jgi:hypothetical protein